MGCWGELKSLRGQSVSAVRLVATPTNGRKAGYAPVKEGDAQKLNIGQLLRLRMAFHILPLFYLST